MSTHVGTNEHIDALHEHVRKGGEFEMPRGVVNRLLEEAGDGKFTWPIETTARKLEDGLIVICSNPAFEDNVDFHAAVALYDLGVRVK